LYLAVCLQSKHGTVAQETPKKNVQGGTLVKTLSDVAASYDQWADANQAAAEDILARLDSVSDEIRDCKRRLAEWFLGEAAELRARAAELRNVNCCHSVN